MSWILGAIEREAEWRAAERLIKEAKVNISPRYKKPGWQIEVTFGEEMPFIRSDMDQIMAGIENYYDDCIRSQVSHLTELLAGFRLTVDLLEARLVEAQAEKARQGWDDEA